MRVVAAEAGHGVRVVSGGAKSRTSREGAKNNQRVLSLQKSAEVGLGRVTRLERELSIDRKPETGPGKPYAHLPYSSTVSLNLLSFQTCAPFSTSTCYPDVYKQ
jgi:hypothetical protein